MTIKDKLKQEIEWLSDETVEEAYYFIKFIEIEKEKRNLPDLRKKLQSNLLCGYGIIRRILHMIDYKKGSVILVPFPFSDQSGIKKRPAVIVSSEAYNGLYQDVVICAITSRIDNKLFALEDWKAGGLLFPSAVKPVISTIDRHIIIKTIGALSSSDMKIIEKIKKEIFGDE